ncbi:phage tail tape measure protein [Limnobaculum xujianqingii]|uniref:phage tail tape measure protein n=1 Tax=Limnobaculum xujianqingii TaxID=2738837 RepID=UPI001E6376E3|nr:phage tail tape measure protein [Limnobaculum xujianqingii]
MSRSGLNLALTLFARDNASKVINKTLQDVVKGSTAAQKATDKLAGEQKKSADTGIKASRTLADEMRRSASARSTLGIRSEQQIRREIQQTEAAYNRLARSGTMSANEQSRAYAGMQKRIGSLKTELGGVNQQMSMFQRAKGMALTGGAIVGGITAASAVIAQPVRNNMSYKKRLALMANTAYADGGVEERQAGMKNMDTMIEGAVTQSGGSKETAAEALDIMLASGAVNIDSAKSLLPVIQKFATSAEAAPADVVNIMKALKTTFGIKDEDMATALNMTLVAGQEGSFELSDMARSLPKQFAAAGNLGMGGLDDLATILSANQAAAITAGSSDEAGTNMINLLTKMNSQDAKRALAKVKVNGKGIDLPGTLAEAKGKGTNQFDAFMNIVDTVVANDPAYQKMEKRYLQAKGTEKEQLYTSMKKTLDGSAAGSVISDQQAMMALVGYRSNREYAKGVADKSNAQRNLKPGELSAVDIGFEVMKSTPDFKVNQLNNAKDFAEIKAMDPLSNALGDLSDKLTEYSSAYPGLTTIVVGATDAIKAMAAAAAVFGGIKMLGGGMGGNGGGLKFPGSKSGIGIPGLPGLTQSVAGAIPVEVTNWPEGGLFGKDDDDKLDKPDMSTGIVDTALALVTEQWNIKEEAAKRGMSAADLAKEKGDARG